MSVKVIIIIDCWSIALLACGVEWIDSTHFRTKGVCGQVTGNTIKSAIKVSDYARVSRIQFESFGPTPKNLSEHHQSVSLESSYAHNNQSLQNRSRSASRNPNSRKRFADLPSTWGWPSAWWVCIHSQARHNQPKSGNGVAKVSGTSNAKRRAMEAANKIRKTTSSWQLAWVAFITGRKTCFDRKRTKGRLLDWHPQIMHQFKR